MNITSLLAENLVLAFDGKNWTDVSVADVLSDISYDEANAKTPASPNTIAGLVHHLMFWNTVIIQRIHNNDPEIPETNGFDVDVLRSEEEWQSLIQRARQSFLDLAAAIRNFPPERLNDATNFGKSTFRLNLFGIIEHAYYHLGQIMILKKFIKKLQVTN